MKTPFPVRVFWVATCHVSGTWPGAGNHKENSVREPRYWVPSLCQESARRFAIYCHLIFTPTLWHKSHYLHSCSKETKAWRVLCNLPKVTMLLRRKVKTQTLAFVFLKAVFLLPFFATFLRWIGYDLHFQRVLSLVGMKFPSFGKPLGMSKDSLFQLGSWHPQS